MPDKPIEEQPKASAEKGAANDNAESSSSLHVLKRQLYARDESAEITSRNKEVSELSTNRGEAFGDGIAQPTPVEFADVLSKRTRKRKNLIRIVSIVTVAIVIFAVAVTGTIWYRSSKQLAENQITIALTAPQEFASGDIITYTASYKNDSRVVWKNVEVGFELPKGFRFRESNNEFRSEGRKLITTVPDVSPGGIGRVELSGQLIGEHQSSQLAQVSIKVSPENFINSEFIRSSTLTTTIRSVPVEFAIEASEHVAQNERIVATLHVRNISSSPIEGGYLNITIPAGMQVAPEDPAFSPGYSVLDNEWELPTLAPFDEIRRILVLYVEGQKGERRVLEAQVGVQVGEDRYVQREISYVATLAASELTVDQFFNNQNTDQAVQTEQVITGVIKYKNTGTVGLKNVIVSTQFQGSGFNAAKLKLDKGAYDPASRTITWTSATVPELANVAPNQESELKYTFEILPIEQFPLEGENITNNALVAVTSVDSPDLPASSGGERKIATDRLTLSLSTNLTLGVDAFYDDGRLGLKSTGPLPPQVGEQTTYTIRFRAGSALNDAGDVNMVAVLPDGVKYTGNVYKTVGSVDYNDRSGEITWNIPLLKALSGRSLLPEELHVQVAITPGENKRGSVIPFLNKIAMEGFDTFIDAKVSLEPVTDFPSTETASRQNGTVE